MPPLIGSSKVSDPHLLALFGEHIEAGYALNKMARVLSLANYSRDTWISQAEFTVSNRRVVNLARVGLLFVDLDTYKSELMQHRTFD